MPKSRFFSEDRIPYHVTARSNHQEWFELPMIEIWDLFSKNLYFMTLTFGVRIHSFVLMSNHFHLLITTPNQNLEDAMEFLLREVGAEIRKERENLTPVFDGDYQASAIRSRIHYEFAYKYVYRNPVEARICSRVENYPYSTLRGLLGKDRLPFPTFDNMNLIVHPAQQLSWLNSPYPTSDFLEQIREGMKESEFELDLGSGFGARPRTHFSNELH